MPGSFLRVRCPECGNEQIIFEKAASIVECASCGEVLGQPTGGHSALSAEVVDIVEARS